MTFAYDHVYQDDVPRWDQVAQRGYSRLRVRSAGAPVRFARPGPETDRQLVRRAHGDDASWVRSRERRERQRVGSSTLTTEQDTVNDRTPSPPRRGRPAGGPHDCRRRRGLRDRWTAGASTRLADRRRRSRCAGCFPTAHAGARFAAGFGLASSERAGSARMSARATRGRASRPTTRCSATSMCTPDAWVGRSRWRSAFGRSVQRVRIGRPGVPRAEPRRPQHPRPVRLRRRGPAGRASSRNARCARRRGEGQHVPRSPRRWRCSGCTARPDRPAARRRSRPPRSWTGRTSTSGRMSARRTCGASRRTSSGASPRV